MSSGDQDVSKPRRPLLSKRMEIGMAALAFAGIFGGIVGVELQNRGLLTPARVVWLIMCAVLGGAAFGLGFWHLHVKRRGL